LAAYRPRYNVAPGDRHYVLRVKAGEREVIAADWGLINHWSKDPSVAFKQINARAEGIAERPAWRDAFVSRRCVVLADGFYEWRGPKGAREPLWFHRPDAALMLFAGLYEGWLDPTTGDVKKTFTVVTTTPNPLVAPIHDRMPAIVAERDIDAWLTGSEPAKLLAPAPPESMAMHPASPRVNTAVNDDPMCLDADDPMARRQLSLF
jgi:putative SOS response-associated peptidase YedK